MERTLRALPGPAIAPAGPKPDRPPRTHARPNTREPWHQVHDLHGTVRSSGLSPLPALVRVCAVAMSYLPRNGLRRGQPGYPAPATPAEADLLKLDQSTHIALWVDWKTHVPPPGEE
ncbi:hypothetical protein GCM10023259_022070 [Thermocatellispora tengchongensis]